MSPFVIIFGLGLFAGFVIALVGISMYEHFRYGSCFECRRY